MNWFKNVLGLKPSQNEFVEIAKQALRDFGLGTNFRYDAEQFCLNVLGPDNQTVASYMLHNAYDSYCNARGEERNQVLAGFFIKAPEIPDSLEEASANLLVRIQDLSYFHNAPLIARVNGLNRQTDDDDGNMQIPYVKIAPYFGYGLVYDDPQSVQSVGKDTIKGWNTSQEELFQIGFANLRKITDKSFQEFSPGLYTPGYGDSHDASRLLIRERIAECHLKGRPVALIANRDSLMIAGDEDQQAIATMLKMGEKLLDQPRAMPMIPLVFDSGHWVDLELPQNHPEYQLMARLKAITISRMYAEQKGLLEQVFKAERQDVFVATYMATEQKGTGAITSFATWSEGVPSYLPKAENICFVLTNGKPMTVPWAAAREIAGSLMQPCSYYPERYFVDSFPTQEQLHELQKNSQ